MPLSPVQRRLAAGYRSQLTGLSTVTAATVGGVWARLVDVEQSEAARFAVVAGTVTAMANVRAVHLADTYVADALTVALRRPTVVPAADPARYASVDLLVGSYGKVAHDPDGMFRAERVARAEPLAAGLARLTRHVSDERRVHWIRETSGSACEICEPRDGETIDPQFDVSLHLNCSCTATPEA